MSSDCLLWIDGPYKTAAQFFSEAESRGCCRRMGTWPSWARPGKTRVFLAHRDGHRRTDTGSIIGYFTLAGVGVLFKPEDYHEYGALVDDYRAASEGKADPEPLLDYWRAEKRKPPRGVPGGSLAHDDDFLVDLIVDFLVDCGRAGSGYAIPLDLASLEAERVCGARSDDGAIYFVDELARDIDSRFCKLLETLIEEALNDRPKRDRAKVRRDVVKALKKRLVRSKGRSTGIAEFGEAVERSAARRRSVTPIPRPLAGIAKRLGGLVVFESPYPSFRRVPQAAFRGYLRVDGDELLVRIGTRAKADRGTQIILPYRHTAVGKRKTHEQLVTDLAVECQMSKEFAGEVLGAVAEIVDRELEERGWVTLTGVGTLKVVETARSGRQVRFEPSAALRRRAGL
jgi:nucleoid DNA-binding protein